MLSASQPSPGIQPTSQSQVVRSVYLFKWHELISHRSTVDGLSVHQGQLVNDAFPTEADVRHGDASAPWDSTVGTVGTPPVVN